MYEPNETRRLIKDMAPDERPLNRLSQYGAHSLSNADLIALITGRPDGLDLGQEMLNYFGSIQAMAMASVHELQSFYGVGYQTAVRLRCAMVLGVRSITTRMPDRDRITSPTDAANIVMPLLANKAQEHLMVLVLNTRNQVIKTKVVYVGSINSSVVRIAELFRVAIVHHGAAIIIAHNHPSGDPSPSPEDVHVTRQIVKAGSLMDIELLDHIVVGNGRYVSMKERGLVFD